MAEKKYCEFCQYAILSVTEDPCISCHVISIDNFSNFEPKREEEQMMENNFPYARLQVALAEYFEGK